jgi:hypothetical protein
MRNATSMFLSWKSIYNKTINHLTFGICRVEHGHDYETIEDELLKLLN